MTTRSPCLIEVTAAPTSWTIPEVLVAEHDARLGGRAALVHVQVRTADGAGGDADDDVVGMLDPRVLDVLDRDLERPLVDDSLHGALLGRCGGRITGSGEGCTGLGGEPCPTAVRSPGMCNTVGSAAA